MPKISQRLTSAMPAAAGLSQKTLANVRSDFSAAVRTSGIRPAPSPTNTPMTPSWRKLMTDLSAKRMHIGLSHLARWCSGRGIEPERVTVRRRQEELAREGIAARVVSMPSWELFEQQDQAYRDSLLPPEVTARVSVEQASVIGWDRYVGMNGAKIGMHTFGSSAPLKDLLTKFGFTPGQSGCGGQRSDREIAKA